MAVAEADHAPDRHVKSELDMQDATLQGTREQLCGFGM